MVRSSRVRLRGGGRAETVDDLLARDGPLRLRGESPDDQVEQVELLQHVERVLVVHVDLSPDLADRVRLLHRLDEGLDRDVVRESDAVREDDLLLCAGCGVGRTVPGTCRRPWLSVVPSLVVLTAGPRLPHSVLGV